MEIAYGEGYRYDHEYDYHYSGQEHLPDRLAGTKYYHPTKFGFEKVITERLKWWEDRKKEIQKGKAKDKR